MGVINHPVSRDFATRPTLQAKLCKPEYHDGKWVGASECSFCVSDASVRTCLHLASHVKMVR